MASVDVNRVSHQLPGGRTLLDDVSFRVGDGEHVALIGGNGTGKTTLLRILAGDEVATAGSVRIDGRFLVMRQFVGRMGVGATVRDLLLELAPAPVREAAARVASTSIDDGMAYGRALADWGDAGGYDAEVLWDTCTTIAMGLPFDDAGGRPLDTLSGGEQKRLAIEALLRSDADVLLLDEPDNFLDVPGKLWLEEQLAVCRKTILFVSHDRELLAAVPERIVTLEGGSTWTHGGSFTGYAEARAARLDRLDERHRRWHEERDRLYASMKEMKRRAAISDANASRARALETKFKRFDEAGPPPERPTEQRITMRLGGDRTGKRAVVIESLCLTGLTKSFDVEIDFGERVGICGRNGTGKSHFLRLLAGGDVEQSDVDHTGNWRLGARVVPGHFSQLHDRPDLAGQTVLALLASRGFARGEAMAALRRYELTTSADQTFETLSGGQQARLQVLLLESSGATLLLLDEPTDNLDLVSAEALEVGLESFTGTVVAVSHDRWFLRSFDRYLIFGQDGSVVSSDHPDAI